MKKIIAISLFICTFQMGFSQNAFTLNEALDRLDNFKNSSVNMNPDFINAQGKAVKVDNVDGSIYWNENFKPGKIMIEESGQKINANLRYRIYDDKFEIKENSTDSKTITLPRSGKYGFSVDNARFVFLDQLPVAVGGKYNGYAMELVGGQNLKAQLYKRLSQEYFPPEKSATPLGYSSRAKLENESTYLLKISGKFYLIEAHKRKAAEAFPDKNKELENYIDENKLKFRGDDKEADLVKLVEYYNTL